MRIDIQQFSDSTYVLGAFRGTTLANVSASFVWECVSLMIIISLINRVWHRTSSPCMKDWDCTQVGSQYSSKNEIELQSTSYELTSRLSAPNLAAKILISLFQRSHPIFRRNRPEPPRPGSTNWNYLEHSRVWADHNCTVPWIRQPRIHGLRY